jgi:hypothetical protein
MSTVPLAHAAAHPPSTSVPAVAAARARAPGLLAFALLGLIAYGAFSHGAVGSAAEARLQVVVAVVAAIAAGALLWTRTLRLAASPSAYAGIALLAMFGVWSGISLTWSVAPDQTWLELNRLITYVIVLGLALALGASLSRPLEVMASGFLVVALVVTVYALGQKLLPGLHIGGLFDLNQTGPLPRLQEPLGYWNALALFIVLGVPAALAIASDRQRTSHLRLGTLVAVELMLVTIGFTYSRGGVLALAVGLAAGLWLGVARLRSLVWLAAAAAAAAPPLVFGLTDHALTSAFVGLGSREGAGALLLVILLLSSACLVAVAGRLLDREQRLDSDPELRRRVTVGLASLLAAGCVIAVLAAALSTRGLDGTISHAWKSFTATRGTSIYNPHRLLSADSENRWVWWKEAAGAFSDRPLTGWGAGSFPVVHLLYRRDRLSVQQPHSAPLQWLAETGVVGGLLAILGCGMLILAGGRAVRRRSTDSERLLAAAVLAAVVAYFFHVLYDWDWDIPGVTLPALVLIGVLAGSSGGGRLARTREFGPGPTLRALSLAGLTVWLCLFASSAALPSIAASKARSALVTAAGSSDSALTSAQATAELAARLDPLSDSGPRAEATIALRRGQLRQARTDLINAVARDPSDVQAWETLASTDFIIGDLRSGENAADRVLALDPLGQLSSTVIRGAAQSARLFETPPKDSATAAPLPGG